MFYKYFQISNCIRKHSVSYKFVSQHTNTALGMSAIQWLFYNPFSIWLKWAGRFKIIISYLSGNQITFSISSSVVKLM